MILNLQCERRALWAWATSILMCGAVYGQELRRLGEAVKLSATYYVDSREFPTASVAMSSNRLPFGWVVWGFTDWHGDHDAGKLSLTRSFSEYRLSHAGPGRVLGIEGLGVQAEINAISGPGNDVGRVGLTYRHTWEAPWRAGAGAGAGAESGWLQWRVFPYETDRDGGQASLIYYLPITARTHLKGFIDYNQVGSDHRWVIEPELNVRVSRNLWSVVELRYSGFEDHHPAQRGTGVALGLRYQF